MDVSKATLDAALCHQDSPDQFSHQQFANTAAGFKQLLTCGSPPGLEKQKVVVSQSFFCMEHTGSYTLALCCFLQDQGLSYNLFSLPSPSEEVFGHHPR